MPDHPAAPLARVTRDDRVSGRPVVESSHLGSVVVVGPDGTVVGALGDPDRVTFVRSTVKPFQATACLEILDEHGTGEPLSAAELAIGQASHRGEPRHRSAVRSLLDRAGLAPDDLTTPPARPAAEPGLAPAPLLHNCSGKHALFALAGRALAGHAADGSGARLRDGPGAQLLDPDAPLQRRVLGVLEEVLGPPAAIGTDGCGAPAVAVPLRRLAEAFRRLRSDDRFARVRSAATTEPGLVGGEGQVDSVLLRLGVSAKVGAEGVHAAGWLDADGGSWGLAVKCEDGAVRGADAGLWHTLAAAGVVAPEAYTVAPPLGGGRPVGAVLPSEEVTALGRTLARRGPFATLAEPLVP